MLKDRWALLICACGGRDAPDVASLGLKTTVHQNISDPGAGAAPFARAVKEAGAARVMISCSQGAAPYEEAFRQEGISPRIHEVDLERFCYGAHPGDRAAHRKAGALLRGAMFRAEREMGVEENPLTVGRRLLIATDHEGGAAAAERLSSLGDTTVAASGAAETMEGVPAGRIRWGRLTGLKGSLGRFTAQIARPNGNGSEPEPEIVAADQVVLAYREAPPPLMSRTGLHVLDGGDPEALESLAAQVEELTGTFMKPVHVTYNEQACAGGAAQWEACGRCIPVCPYGSITRQPGAPLRIEVDHLSCEGCGACTSACPTGALEFTDPAPGQLYGQLGGLLAGWRGGGSGDDAEPSPPTVVFHCPEQGLSALRMAGETPIPYGANLLPLEVPCLRHVSMAAMMAAFRVGAAGVALLGCDECPHGERELLERELALTGRVLDAFGLGADRLRMFTTSPATFAETIPALDRFAKELAPSPIRFEAKSYHGGTNRQVIAEALETFIVQLKREPGGLPVKPHDPFALPVVDEDRCTLCRSCANVCPTHAFGFDGETQSLSLKPIDCVACGLCEKACPEAAIHLRRELYLEQGALEKQVVAQDEMVACNRCGKPHINKKALAAVESRLLKDEALRAVGDTFAGARSGLLKMCPDCRAVDAMREVERGWEP